MSPKSINGTLLGKMWLMKISTIEFSMGNCIHSEMTSLLRKSKGIKLFWMINRSLKSGKIWFIGEITRSIWLRFSILKCRIRVKSVCHNFRSMFSSKGSPWDWLTSLTSLTPKISTFCSQSSKGLSTSFAQLSQSSPLESLKAWSVSIKKAKLKYGSILTCQSLNQSTKKTQHTQHKRTF